MEEARPRKYEKGRPHTSARNKSLRRRHPSSDARSGAKGRAITRSDGPSAPPLVCPSSLSTWVSNAPLRWHERVSLPPQTVILFRWYLEVGRGAARKL
eukprot:scaffold122_cov236-Pinguiococcus_pyrenoidosus.AAC.14